MKNQMSGKNLLAAVKNGEKGKLVEYALQNKSKKTQFTFKSALKELSIDEIDNMWDKLNKAVIDQVESIIGSTTKRSPNKSKGSLSKKAFLDIGHVIQAAIDLACSILEQSMPASEGLIHMVVFLNRIIFELPNILEHLQNSIALLCEKMFHFNYLYQDHELVTFNVFLYLINRSLAQKPTKKDVKRIYALRTLIPKIISMQGEVDVNEVFNLYKKCATSPLYLSMLEGEKIIALILTLDSDYVSQILEAIKLYLPSATLKQGSAYGKACLDAWSLAVKTNNGDLQKELEMWFQDLIMTAINGQQKSRMAVTRKLFAEFLTQKKEHYVSKMLYNMYHPILWRSVKQPDGLVRANAAQLFLDVFPLEDPDIKIVDVERELNEQMLLILDLLIDDYPIVRSATVIGLCISMSVHWEIFPEDMLATYIRTITCELSHDSSSSDVRCAVAKGFKVILENPLTWSTMQTPLLKLSHMFHDISDPVRIAFCQLLLRVKKISSIKYFNIVPIDHLLARMEEDTVIAKLIVNLIYNSYFPKDESPDGWLTRCVELIKKDRGASRVFFQYAPCFIAIDTTATFIIHAMKGIEFYSRNKHKFKRDKKLHDSLHTSMEDMEEAVNFNDLNVVSGLIDAVVIMWISSLHNLEKPENKNLLKIIVGKLSKWLPDLAHHYKNSSPWESIFYLCSFMPSCHIPSLGSLCFEKIENLDSSAVKQDYMTLLECLCNRNESLSLIIIFEEWIEKGIKLTAAKSQGIKKRKSQKVTEPAKPKFDKHFLAVDMLHAVLNHRSCQKAVLKKHSLFLKNMLKRIDKIKEKIELFFEQNFSEEEKTFLKKMLFVLLQISVLLHADGEYNCVKFGDDIVLWIQNKLFKLANLEIGQKTTPKRSRLKNNQQYAAFEQFIFELSEGVCCVIIDMALMGYYYPKTLKFLKFGMNLLTSGFGGKLLLSVSKLLLNHITREVYKTIEERDSSILKFVPDTFNKIIQCLKDEKFLKAVPITDSKDIQSLLAECLLLMYPKTSLKDLVSSVITMVIKTILNSIIDSVDNWDNIEKKCDPFQLIPISKFSAFLLHIMCMKPKIMVHFLQQLQKNLVNSGGDIRIWVACYVIVVNISEIRNFSKTISKEINCLVDKMEGLLLEQFPLKDIDTNLPLSQDVTKSSNEEEEDLNFGEHCQYEYKKLKSLLSQKTKMI